MSEPDDTSEVGRIKTDKTVRSAGFSSINREDGSLNGEEQIGDNFTVTFSALSSGGTIAGQSSIPADVVLILDTSVSMNTANGSESRTAAMVDAVNSTIAQIMQMNPDNRVGVVCFGTGATTLFPLQSITEVTDGNYISINNRAAGVNATITPNAAISGGTAVTLTNGTNAQAGIYWGMDMLVNADPKVTIGGVEYDRVPGVIIVSDGAAADMVNNSSWYSLNSTDANIHGQVSSTNARVAHWFIPALEASYMKNKINENYGENDCYVATVGFDLSSESTVNQAIAHVVLNPSEYVAEDGTVTRNPSSGLTSDAASVFRTAYRNMIINHRSASLNYASGSTITFNYPTGDDAQYMPENFHYNDTYIEVDDAAGLAEELMKPISAITDKAYSPTNTTDITGEHSGYIVFTDTLGELMEVKNFTSILWVDHDPDSPTYGQETEYTNVSKTTNGNVDTYVFNDEVHSSWLFDYETTNLNNIIIEVDRSGDQEVVTIKIPPALLPMVDYEVAKDGNTVTSVTRNEETRPIKINYVVGPKEGVIDYLSGESTGDDLSAELKAQADAYAADSSHIVTTAEGTGLALYTNAWAGSDEVMVPVAEFGINPLNDYYSFAKRTLLYTDPDCTTPATSFEAGATYYYTHDVYIVGETGAAADDVVKTPISSLTASDVETIGGQLYAKAGVQKDLPAQDDKNSNNTDTRDYRLRSHWQNGTTVHQHQGNNGRLVIQTPGNLKIDKTITTDAGVTNADAAQMAAKLFSFKIDLVDDQNATLDGSYPYVIQDLSVSEDQWTEGTLQSGDVLQITEGQTILIKNIPAGSSYTVTEQDIPQGYTLTKIDGADAPATSAASGTIESGITAEHEFTNNYSFSEPYVLENRPHVRKVLEGREITDDDEFIVNISQYASNPAGATIISPTLTISTSASGATVIDSNNIDAVFQGVSFTQPGEYWFRIAEQNDGASGIAYSQSVYAYVVVVSDNGDGTMSVATDLSAANPGIRMEKTIDKDGTSVAEGEGIVSPITIGGEQVLEATFTNTYSIDEITIGTPGEKAYTDSSGANPLTANMFQFELRPSFYDADGVALPQSVIDGVPMPEGTESTTYTDRDTGLTYTRKDTFNSASGDFGFGLITFSTQDVGNTYRYVVQEIIPDEALANGTRTYVKRSDSTTTVETTDDHGYLWTNSSDGGEIYDLKTISYKGYVYDCSRHVVVVEVSQDGDHISADVQYQTSASQSANKIEIANSYEPTPVTTDDTEGNSISFKKVLEGRDSLDGEEFTFTVTPSGSNSINGVADGYVVLPGGGSSASVSIGSLEDNVPQDVFLEGIQIKRAGTYSFAITENAGSAASLTYDSHTLIAIVEVGLDVDEGRLVINNVSYTGDQTFTNSYNPDEVHFGSLGAIQINKMVQGRAMIARKYGFTIAPADDNARAKTSEALTVNNASAAADGVEAGTQALTDLSFTRDDIGKTFTYTVTENIPQDATDNGDGTFTYEGITYASDGNRVQTVTLEVTDDGENNIKVTATAFDEDGNQLGEQVVSDAEAAHPLVVHYVNSYSFEPLTYASPSYIKLIEGREWQEGDSFTFRLTASADAPLPQKDGQDNTVATVGYADVVDGVATFDFGPATFTKPGTYTYTVVEDESSIGGISTDSASHTIQIVVTDNGDGTLSTRTTASATSRTFTNTYSATLDFSEGTASVVDVTKELIGRSMRDREFMIDVRAIDVVNGEGAHEEGYATAEETAARFGMHTSEIVAIEKPDSGSAYTTSAIPGIEFTERDAGITYVFELKEFVPTDATDATLEGASYKMRDGVYYNTNGIDHWRAEIAVEDNGDGTLKVTTTLTPHNEDHNAIDGMNPIVVVNDGTVESIPAASFQNTYDATGTATINAIKDLEGREWTNDDSFEFVIDRMVLEDGTLVEAPDDTSTPLPTGSLYATKDTDLVGSDGTQHMAVQDPDAATLVNGWTITISESDLHEDTDGVMKGDFYYRIREVGPDGQPASGGTVDGVSYSTTERYIHVHAQDLRTGNIAISVDHVTTDDPNTGLGFTPVFTNRYAATNTYQIPVTKVLTGRSEWTNADSYQFRLTALNSSYPMPEEDTTITINADSTGHAAEFGAITFTAPGTYNYLVQEIEGSVPGVSYDENSDRRVRIVVTDDGKGSLTIDSVSFYSDSAYTQLQDDQESAVFTNAYEATTGTLNTADLFGSVTKELTGRAFRASDSFSFEITAPEGAPLPSDVNPTITPTAGESTYSFDFGTIEFTQEHVSLSPIIYTISEIAGTSDGITYDTHKERVQITLTDDGEGNITAIATLLNDGEGDTSEDELLFVNEYKATGSATINVIKDFQGRDEGWLEGDSFSFTIAPVKLVDGSLVAYESGDELVPMPASTQAVATRNNAQVTDDEYFAEPAWTVNFESSSEHQDLSYDSSLGRMTGDFFYRVDEVVPAAAVNGAGVNYAQATDAQKVAGGFTLDGISYDTAPRYIHVHAEDDRHGNIVTTIYYDETTPGDPTTAKSATPVFENTYASPTAALTVSKAWNDDNNRDGRRADVILHLFRRTTSGELVQVEVPTITLATGTNHTTTMEGTWENLPVYETDGTTKIVYVVQEEAIAGYTPTITPETITLSETNAQANAVAISNAYSPAVSSVTVTKSWDDNDDMAGVRPDSVTVTLKAGSDNATDASGATLPQADLNEQNNWTYTWDNLPSMDGGTAIAYSVEETALDSSLGYEDAVVTGCANEGFTITNTRRDELVSASVTKVWDDDSNHDGARPNYVEFELLANGEPTGRTIKLAGEGSENSWTASLEGLPKYAGGSAITYSWRETVPAGYSANGTGSGSNEVANGGTITNTRESDTLNIAVTKSWNDDNNAAGVRPGEVTVNLLANGTATGDTLTLNANGSWTGSFESLPRYDNGDEIFYTVTESEVAGYTASITGSATAGFTITNSYGAQTTSHTVMKRWVDNNNQDGTRPSSLTISLLANGNPTGDTLELNDSNNWTGVFENLPLIVGGQTVEYSASEANVAGYTSEQRTDSGVTVFTNTHNTTTTSVSATKVWVDDDNALGLRAAVTLTLTGTAGGETLDFGTRTIAQGESQASWDDIPTSHNGEALSFQVSENALYGYTSSVTQDSATSFTVTNTLVEQPAEVSVSKTFADADNQDGIRPGSVTVTLMRKVGTGEPEAVDSQVLSADNSWSYTWSDLLTVEEDEPVLYAVEEQSVPNGYTSRVISVSPGVFEVVNTHTPATTSVSATKVWADNEDSQGMRPGYVTVHLFANGEEVSSKVIAGSERVTWDGLPANASGSPIAYTLTEDSVSNYTSSITGDAESGFVLTNTYNSLLNVSATKVWEGDDDDTSGRSSVTFHLMKQVAGYGAVEVEGAAQSVSVDGEQTVSWTGLPTAENGLAITYSVVEDEIEGYSTSYSSATYSDDGSVLSFIITNTKEHTTPIPDPDPDPDPNPDPDTEPIIVISYVDHLNAAGSEVLKMQRLTQEEYASLDNTHNEIKPEDPSHDSNTFQQWDRNITTNEEGDILITYVAVFQDTSTKKITVSYVDPQSDGQTLVKSEQTTDEANVEAPANPSHEGCEFVEWVRNVDAGGNVIYAAKYMPKDCETEPEPAPTPAPNSEPTPTPNHTPSSDNGGNSSQGTTSQANSSRAERTPDTGDYTTLLPALISGVAGLVACVGAGILRKQDAA